MIVFQQWLMYGRMCSVFEEQRDVKFLTANVTKQRNF